MDNQTPVSQQPAAAPSAILSVEPEEPEKKQGWEKKFLLWLIIIFILFGGFALGIFLQVELTSPKKVIPSPTPKTSPSPGITTKPAPASNTRWKVFHPKDYTYLPADKSFQFTYSADWAYETIDGIIPEQQHIVQVGPERTLAEREALAKKAGIELNDSRGSISFVDPVITLYYTDNPDYTVTNLEDLATGSVLSKKQIIIDKTIMGLEMNVDCPTECTEVVFVNGQRTFTFIIAKAKEDTQPLDSTILTQILSTFTFLE